MTSADHQRINDAIDAANAGTTGVVAVRIVPDETLDAYQRAATEFETANLASHEPRNAALVLVAPHAKQYAVLGDAALHERVGAGFWDELTADMRPHFAQGSLAGGILLAVKRIGAAMRTHFPAEDTP